MAPQGLDEHGARLPRRVGALQIEIFSVENWPVVVELSEAPTEIADHACFIHITSFT